VSESTLAPITPQALIHLGNFKAESAAIVKRIEGRKLRTPDDARAFALELGELKRLKTHAEQVRKKELDPLNFALKSVREQFRPVIEGLDEIEAAAKKRLLAYHQAEAERVAAENARIEREKAEAMRKRDEALAAAERAKTEAGRDKAMARAEKAQDALTDARLAVPEQAGTTIRTDAGTSSVRKVWKFQVVSEDLLPREFLKTNEQKIRAAIMNGVREIPGVVIYEDESIAVRVAG
jgi:hypothetical protein